MIEAQTERGCIVPLGRANVPTFGRSPVLSFGRTGVRVDRTLVRQLFLGGFFFQVGVNGFPNHLAHAAEFALHLFLKGDLAQ
jgi:hypothetical protein